jgi:hypothetical protein
MSGYAASARIHGASPRFTVSGRRATDLSTEEAFSGPFGRPPTDLSTEEAFSGPFGRRAPDPTATVPPVRDRLVARWDDLREAWSQTTFFLFDPNSWR